MITALIVDDEPYSCEVLATLLERYCPEVQVLDICYTAEEALSAIGNQMPQLLFLDIEMPFMNGFELLCRIPEINFEVVFTTSYDQYALKAIKFSALDYLLKPIDKDELQRAVGKISPGKRTISHEQIRLLLDRLEHPSVTVSKIAIPTLEGLQMISTASIVHCDADRNYTIIHTRERQKVIASRTLKEIEEILEDAPFLRVHHSHLVNLNEIEKYVRGEGGYLQMSNGAHIDVSRSRKENLLQKLQPGRS
jgi:two-component system LytT family response regulator